MNFKQERASSLVKYQIQRSRFICSDGEPSISCHATAKQERLGWPRRRAWTIWKTSFTAWENFLNVWQCQESCLPLWPQAAFQSPSASLSLSHRERGVLLSKAQAFLCFHPPSPFYFIIYLRLWWAIVKKAPERLNWRSLNTGGAKYHCWRLCCPHCEPRVQRLQPGRAGPAARGPGDGCTLWERKRAMKTPPLL